ncbi:MAG: FUSC family protein [Acholeplasmatales bacterium]|nr:FUSC family protein [Acholeplasmatales bacterium]
MRIARFFGKRTVKTAVSIGFCMLLYIILKTLDVMIKIDGVSLYDKETGFRFSDFYSPFFAGIAAAYSLYPSKKESIAQAKNRVVASLLGGIIGIILTISYGLMGVISGSDFFEWPNLGDSYRVSQYIIPYILITFFVMVVIAVGNLINKKNAIFVGVLTFISVTINPMGMIVSRYDESALFLGEAVFGFNRILSTVVGVLLALAVNLFRLPHKNKNKDLLFVVGLEEALKDGTLEFEGFFKYKLKDFTYRNIPLSLYTTYTPMRFMTLLKDVELTSPVICMSGAALYDSVKDDYVYQCPLRDEDSKDLAVLLSEMGVVPFKNTIVDDTLFITTYDLDYKYNRMYH